MTLTRPISSLVTFGVPFTQGASDAARFVEDQVQENRRHLQSSYVLGLESRGVFDELYAIAEATHEAGWDGYGADPVSQEVFRHAYRFVESLPFGIQPPVVTAEPDGQVAFEWYVSPHRTLSVSVSPTGDLHYSALLGPNKTCGTEVFFGEAPAAILELVRRVHNA
jgi:hypothetical protein